jgi:lipid-A-disaccharide synthase
VTGAPAERPFTAFLIAGEESGDQLGHGLMQALVDRLDGNVRFLGVGGERMARLGLRSIFPMEEVSFHGITDIIANLGTILSRMRSTARAVVAAHPDVLVIIDLPGFNLGVARRVRKWRPSIAIIEYVSPTVWVWRPGRARRIARFVDHILAILPFEPEVHRRLRGPACSYVGHPLTERLHLFRPRPGERPPLDAGVRPTVLVLPGSRRSEIGRLTAPFGEALALLADRRGPIEIVLPAVPRFAEEIRARVADWKVTPQIVVGEADKFAAFRRAHAALAASGTVTLELALAGVPTVVAYRVDILAKLFKRLVLSRVRSIVLPNLILDDNAIPEFIDDDGSPEHLAAALAPLLRQSPERAGQLTAFDRLDGLMSHGADTPSARSADIVIRTSGLRRLEFGAGASV